MPPTCWGSRLTASRRTWLADPIGVLLVAVLHFVPDDDVAKRAAHPSRCPPTRGRLSSHATPGPPDQAEAMREALKVYRELAVPIVPRTPQMVEGFLDGFTLVPPGVVRVDHWQARERDWWPRASWSKLGRPVGVGPGTPSRE